MNKDHGVLNERTGSILFRTHGFPDVTLLLPIDWLQNPFNNVSWRYRLHCMPMIDQFIAGNREQRDCENIANIVNSWITEFGGKSEQLLHPTFCWHDHATALRAINFCKLFEFANANKELFEQSFIDNLIGSIHEHRSLLCKDQFYRKHTNHGMDQAIALLEIGKTIGDAKSIERGVKWLLEEFNFAFTEEGVHKENSPSYHFSVLLRFAYVFETYADMFPGKMQIFKDICNKALLYLAFIIRPDGKIPILGDTQLSGCRFDNMPFLSSLSNFKYFLYAASCGLHGEKLAPNIKIFPKSGYAVFRNNVEGINQLHCVFKAGALSYYHYHQDEGNFIVYAFGEDWIIDSGHYNYEENTAQRKLIRSRNAHNVPVIKNAKYNESDTKHKFSAWQITSWSEKADNPFVQAEHSCLLNYKIQRRLELINDFQFIIYDIIDSELCGENDVETLFHVPVDKKISISGNTITIESKTCILYMTIISQKFKNAYITSGFNSDISTDSIVSYRFNNYEPSQCIHCKFDFDKDTSACYTFRFKDKKKS